MKKLGERPPQLSDVRIIHPDFLRYLYEMYLEKDVPMPTKALTTIVLSLHECDYIRIHGPVVNAESVQYYTEVNSRVGQLLKSDLMEEKLLEYMEREKLLLICVCITGYSPPKPLRTVSLSGTKAVVTPLAVHHASEPFPHTSTTCQLSQFHVPSMISAQHDEAPEAAVPVAGKLQKECIQEEIGKVNRKVCLTQGKAALKSKSCIELENGVYTLVSDNLAVNQKMKAIQDEWKKELKVYVEYREKMGKHMHAVADIEASYRINIAVTTKLKQVELLRKQLQELKTNSEHTEKMLTGESERILQSEINALKAKEIRVNKEIVQKKEKKRNQAQLTRLKRQVKEAQVRNKQWNEEACELETSIAELRNHIKDVSLQAKQRIQTRKKLTDKLSIELPPPVQETGITGLVYWPLHNRHTKKTVRRAQHLLKLKSRVHAKPYYLKPLEWKTKDVSLEKQLKYIRISNKIDMFEPKLSVTENAGLLPLKKTHAPNKGLRSMENPRRLHQKITAEKCFDKGKLCPVAKIPLPPIKSSPRDCFNKLSQALSVKHASNTVALSNDHSKKSMTSEQVITRNVPNEPIDTNSSRDLYSNSVSNTHVLNKNTPTFEYRYNLKLDDDERQTMATTKQ
uniref:Uncharacterized protein LOC102808633 n=1 Tax=Saccoglossus kowalevskii TaxID=10224 RepID=A0ABM0MYC9_SACKO|nr:PREDICTED: uncharacterized protein LOC102808633 [Saccoglossus kowalevskii]